MIEFMFTAWVALALLAIAFMMGASRVPQRPTMLEESPKETKMDAMERHCREDHVRSAYMAGPNGLKEDAQEPYLSPSFQPAAGVSWSAVHNNLHRLAHKHGEAAHRGGDYA